jgi:hypothetical protein
MDDMKKFKDFNFNESLPTIPESNIQEIIEDDMRKDVARSAGDIKEISLEEVADLLEAANYSITLNHAGMVTNTFQHPIIGMATTIQAFGGDGALLIKHL